MSSGPSRKLPSVTVVGAGIVGAALAYTLSRRGVAVTVIDKGRPGGGATSHSFAWINATAKHPVSYHNFNRRSLGMWERFAKGLGVDVGLRWGGQMEWAATAEGAAELESRAAQLQAWGYPCRILDGAQAAQLEPALSLGNVTAAIYCESDGMVEPTLAAEACIRAAAKHGATVKLETEVTSIEADSSIARVVAGGESVESDVVVLAGGLDNTALAAMAGITIPQQDQPHRAAVARKRVGDLRPALGAGPAGDSPAPMPGRLSHDRRGLPREPGQR